MLLPSWVAASGKFIQGATQISAARGSAWDQTRGPQGRWNQRGAEPPALDAANHSPRRLPRQAANSAWRWRAVLGSLAAPSVLFHCHSNFRDVVQRLIHAGHENVIDIHQWATSAVLQTRGGAPLVLGRRRFPGARLLRRPADHLAVAVGAGLSLLHGGRGKRGAKKTLQSQKTLRI